MFGLSVALGPVLGGTLVDAVGWRTVFLVNLPVAALAILLTYRFVPESHAEHESTRRYRPPISRGQGRSTKRSSAYRRRRTIHGPWFMSSRVGRASACSRLRIRLEGDTQMGFTVADVQEAVADLRERGVVFEESPGLKTIDGVAEMDGHSSAWAKDSAGNFIELVEVEMGVSTSDPRPSALGFALVLPGRIAQSRGKAGATYWADPIASQWAKESGPSGSTIALRDSREGVAAEGGAWGLVGWQRARSPASREDHPRV
jgi:hypothetical protein